MFKHFVLCSSLFVSSQALAWSAVSLGGGNWAIICANGTAWSYSGSSAGLDVVGPALCPGGLIVPSRPFPPKSSKGISSRVDLMVIENRKETGELEVQKIRTYPPHGYPCLGCAPCPGNPTEFCDIVSSRYVFINQSIAKLPLLELPHIDLSDD